MFVVFFAGERAKTKVVKICEAFGANRYPFPEDPNRQWQMREEVVAFEPVLCVHVHVTDELASNADFSLTRVVAFLWRMASVLMLFEPL